MVTEPVSQNIVRAEGSLGSLDKSDLLGHGAITAWFTGLSGSGKSTLAFAVEDKLVKAGVLAYVLDGDNVRFGLNRDLGFSPADREENIRRIGEVCRLMTDAGVVVLSSFISPYRSDRDAVRSLHPAEGFVEVFVDTPLEVCEERDVKGLYKKARSGEIPEFSGISAPYEAPDNAEVRIDTSGRAIEECANLVVAEILGRIRNV
ncbi:MAG: adenylyl-sulfate kinase [Actinobacteria bacterium]|nr:adenylyl-sulfate kinase [Actinomycetota bacterium]